MHIAIIGAGNVGSALGRRWEMNGHDIIFGVRNIADDNVQMLLKATSASATSVTDAIAAAAVVVFAVPEGALHETVAQSAQWDGKIVIDAMNRFGDAAYATPTSVAEELQALIPTAHVVKAFNHMGAELMLNPVFGAETLTFFVCGNNADAKATVTELVQEISFDVVDCGPLQNARELEAMARLWVYLSRTNTIGRDFGFKLLRR